MHYLSIAGISLLPVLLGSLCYWLYFIPDLGAFLFRLIPVIMIVIWYQAGKWIAGRVRRPAAAYFGCHWSLWFCLLVHVWQLYLLSPSDRSFFWFQLGNSVSNPLSLLVSRVIFFFSPFPRQFGVHANTILQLLNLVFLSAIFWLGYSLRRRQLEAGDPRETA